MSEHLNLDQPACSACGHSAAWHIRVCGYREPEQKSCPCDLPAEAIGADR